MKKLKFSSTTCIYHEPFDQLAPHKAMEVTYNNSDAKALLNAVCGGDEEAFNRLYRLTCARVSAYLCRLLKDKTEIEDIMTETYIEVWRNAGKFKEESQVLTWITGIARNLAMNWLKRHKVHQGLDDIATQVSEDSEDSHVEKIAGDDRRRIVRDALMSLSELHREILGLVLLKDFSYECIANLLQVPVNTVKTRVFYAKKALHEQLLTIGVTGHDL